jgi:adenine deaminase
VTRAVTERPRIEDGVAVPDTERDILKLVVIERHKATGNIGVGFVRGFGLKSGALGSTVAHDAHNIIVAGTNDADIVAAARELVAMGGGQCVVNGGTVQDRLPLPVAGLVSDRPIEEVRKQVDGLAAAASSLGCTLADPFMTLSFLALSPIPELKVTDQGLVDATKFELTPLFVD